ncbi:MAG: hypothetical protein QM776_17885 [Rhodocyclaceae bacterium]
MSAAIAVVADQKLCLIVKANSPANAPLNAQYRQSLAAAFTYANSAISWNGTRLDLTLIGSASDAGLVLIKTVDKTTAAPGETLAYVIRYENRSKGVLQNLVLFDSTPAYTTFLAANCGSLPNQISACTVSVKPAVGATGALRWTLTGTLQSGASGTVGFSVLLQ